MEQEEEQHNLTKNLLASVIWQYLELTSTVGVTPFLIRASFLWYELPCICIEKYKWELQSKENSYCTLGQTFGLPNKFKSDSIGHSNQRFKCQLAKALSMVPYYADRMDHCLLIISIMHAFGLKVSIKLRDNLG